MSDGERAVFFTFGANVSPERRLELVDTLASWKGIEKVLPLKPGAYNPALARFFYAYATPGTDPAELVERIRSLPEIESASSGPRRKLV